MTDTNEYEQVSTAERLAAGEALDAAPDKLRLMASHDLIATAGALASMAALTMTHARGFIADALPIPGEAAESEHDPAEIADGLHNLTESLCSQLMALRALAERAACESDGLVRVPATEMSAFLDGDGPLPEAVANALRTKIAANREAGHD